MDKPKLYLDNCCFNRPFDDQSHLTVRLETEAVLFIQHKIKEAKIDLAWSSVLDFEIKKNPFEARRDATDEFREIAYTIVEITPTMQQEANLLQSQGLAIIDSLHLVCAISAGCEYFITVDKGILKKPVSGISTINPIHFLHLYEEKQI
jgi:predicted nucleic acid-binding protein